MKTVTKTQSSNIKYSFALMVVAGVSSGSSVRAEPDSRAEQAFATQVFPLLKEKCFACHGEDPKGKLRGGLDMTRRELILKGGGEGSALVPGKPDDSLMFVAATWKDEDLQMPPKENDRLTDAQMKILRDWIAAGAPWADESRRGQLLAEAAKWTKAGGAGQQVKTSGGQSAEWTNRLYEEGDLWAYRAYSKPAVPWSALGGDTPAAQTRGKARGPNPVDAFLQREIKAKGLQSAAAAGREILIRRAKYDLLGLPPTREEIDAFTNDRDPEAFAKLIERLLASEHYGEQWGNHWLDVVRYADSGGYSNDYSRPNAWRYRDYVVRSFNQDKPYDQFVREQIAGDEIDPGNPEMSVAVGFLRMGPWEHTAMSVKEVTRQLFLDDVTNSVGVTFLGNELRCASCHDHKFDPIPTRDYYGIQAVFAPVQLADRKTAFLAHENTAGFDEGRLRFERLLQIPEVRSIDSVPRAERPKGPIDADTDKKGRAKVNRKREDELRRCLKQFQPYAFSVYNGSVRVEDSKEIISEPPKEIVGEPQAVRILKGGAIEAAGEEVGPGVLSAAGLKMPAELSDIPTGLAGRRKAFARWLTHPSNPLTARVMVNRIWQYHFGTAIAANANNFGKMGGKPSHPELLNFLAAYFVENGWSVKAMHRLIMTSQAYQRASQSSDARVAEIDPDNRLLSYFSPRRLTAEQLRDSMLFVSGELETSMGGAPVRPEIDKEVALQPRQVMGSVAPAYQPSRTPGERNRRSIYAERIRTLRHPMLEVFNQPGPDLSCERRDATTVTPQAFSLFNSQNSYNRALAFARRLEHSSSDAEAQIDKAFQLAFGRAPTNAERSQARAHVRKMLRHHTRNRPVARDVSKYVVREMVEEMTGLYFYWVEDLDIYINYVFDEHPSQVPASTRALADLGLVLMNSNEFAYVY